MASNEVTSGSTYVKQSIGADFFSIWQLLWFKCIINIFREGGVVDGKGAAMKEA